MEILRFGRKIIWSRLHVRSAGTALRCAAVIRACCGSVHVMGAAPMRACLPATSAASPHHILKRTSQPKLWHVSGPANARGESTNIRYPAYFTAQRASPASTLWWSSRRGPHVALNHLQYMPSSTAVCQHKDFNSYTLPRRAIRTAATKYGRGTVAAEAQTEAESWSQYQCSKAHCRVAVIQCSSIQHP